MTQRGRSISKIRNNIHVSQLARCLKNSRVGWVPESATHVTSKYIPTSMRHCGVCILNTFENWAVQNTQRASSLEAHSPVTLYNRNIYQRTWELPTRKKTSCNVWGLSFHSDLRLRGFRTFDETPRWESHEIGDSINEITFKLNQRKKYSVNRD